jgi:glutaredoxin
MNKFLMVFSLFFLACTSKLSYKTADIQALAQTVKANDIIMYSTPDCMYCNQAKGWLNQNHFAFTDCDMTASKQCQQQYNDYGGNGTPLIVINNHGKQHIMKDGFDSDELLITLQIKD